MLSTLTARLLAPALLLGLAVVGPARVGAVTFTDVTATAGVSYTQHVYQPFPFCLITPFFCELERMTGGAAVADVDRDGDLDLFVTRLDNPDILFINNGNGTFSDGTAAAGLSGFDLHSNGAGFADVDNDGDPDLYVTVQGAAAEPNNDRNYLYINDGSGVFTEEAVARGADAGSLVARRSQSVAFGDYDRDGWIDIHLTEWLPVATSHARLLHNRGPDFPGQFEDTTVAAGVVQDTVDGFGSSFTDLDGDGWPDLAVSADFGTSRLYWNNGDGTFTDGTVAAGVGTDENGMGSTLGDYDLDGDLDWFVTSIWDPLETCENDNCNWGYTGNRLYGYEGSRTFSDQTDAAGVREGWWGWGAGFFDYDNDGDLDLTMTNGVIFDGETDTSQYVDDPMRVWNNDGSGAMTEVSASVGVTNTGSGKGLAVFDYDDDGDVDLFVANNTQTPVLYRNDGGNDNDWLRIRVRGTATNRDGIGAIIRVQATSGGPVQVREAGTSTHFQAQSEPVAHFGLGPSAPPVHSVEVEWPVSGQTQSYSNVTPNTTLLVTEPPQLPSLGARGLALLVLVIAGVAVAATPVWRAPRQPRSADLS